MKSFRNLWAQLVSWDNLLLAYRKCRRRKRFRRGAIEFDLRWESELLLLQRELIEGIYLSGAYRHFEIRDPKPRIISAAPFRDRVVHHAIVNILEPIYERRFIFDSYACRKGKGTHRAISRAQGYMRRFRYCLKTDIVKFFPSVDHEVLAALLAKRIRDPPLMELLVRVIASGEGVSVDPSPSRWFAGDDLFAAIRPRGLPIGNLTSQFFANVLLDPLDHFIKEELKAPGYVRYADDLVLFSDDKQTLWSWRRAIDPQLSQQRLVLHVHKSHVGPCTRSLTFLGLRISPNEIRLSSNCISRFHRRRRWKQKCYSEGSLPVALMRRSIEAWVSNAKVANSYGLRRALFRTMQFRKAATPS